MSKSSEGIYGTSPACAPASKADPTLKIRIAPLWVIRALGLFSPRMKFVSHLFAYFANHEDPFYANRTWQDLGKPRTTLEMFARSLARTATAL